MPFKILSTADLHLGRKSSSIPRSAGESSVQFSWHLIVEWGLKNHSDTVVLAGDIIDRDNCFQKSMMP